MPTSQRVDQPTPNGGAYSIAYFQDSRGEPVEKVQATAMEIVEFSANGKELMRTYMVKEGSTVLKHLPGKHDQHTHAGHSGASSKVWTGQPHQEPSQLTKNEAGAAGEALAMKVLSEMTGQEFSTLNVGLNNSPIDVAGDHLAVEVKTGMASTGTPVWRANIGQVRGTEKALIEQMTPQQKKAHYDYKRQQIMERKQAMLNEMSREAGAEIQPRTVGVILSPDGRRGDVYMIPGFHLRLSWNQYATDENYLGTYAIDESVALKHLAGRHNQKRHGWRMGSEASISHTRQRLSGLEAEEFNKRIERAYAKLAVTMHPNLKPLEKVLHIKDWDSPSVQNNLSDLALIPSSIHQQVADYGVSIYLGNTTLPFLDDMGHLRGVRPRGWSPGTSWDSVPGGYNREHKRIILGEGRHGSVSLASHEYGHAVDDMLNKTTVGKSSKSAGFRELYDPIRDRLSSYYRQPGNAGLEETFAETFGTIYDSSRTSKNERFESDIGPELLAWVRDIK